MQARLNCMSGLNQRSYLIPYISKLLKHPCCLIDFKISRSDFKSHTLRTEFSFKVNKFIGSLNSECVHAMTRGHAFTDF